MLPYRDSGLNSSIASATEGDDILNQIAPILFFMLHLEYCTV